MSILNKHLSPPRYRCDFQHSGGILKLPLNEEKGITSQ